MGANAQTTVPTFTAGEVLTAAQMNQSARTGVPVFANTSDRDAAFGGTGEKTLAEGQLCYLEDANVVQYYDGSTWATVGPTTPTTPGLELVSATTIGTTVSSVTVTGAFSSTYDNYYIAISGGVGSSTSAQLSLTFGSTTANYEYGYVIAANASVTGVGSSSASSIPVGEVNQDSLQLSIVVINPNLVKNTYVGNGFGYSKANNNNRLGFGGVLKDTTQYTAFTLTPSAGTLTGGTIRVYGYKN